MSRIADLERRIQADVREIDILEKFKALLEEKKPALTSDQTIIQTTYNEMSKYDFSKGTWVGYLQMHASTYFKDSTDKVVDDWKVVNNYLNEVDKAITFVDGKIKSLFDDIAACEAEIEAIRAEEARMG